MNTPYAELPESEKESDRAEADKMLAIVAVPALLAEAERQRAENARLIDALNTCIGEASGYAQERDEALRAVSAANARADAAEGALQALRPYANHREKCAWVWSQGGYNCTCGLDPFVLKQVNDALRAAAARPQETET